MFLKNMADSICKKTGGYHKMHTVSCATGGKKSQQIPV